MLERYKQEPSAIQEHNKLIVARFINDNFIQHKLDKSRQKHIQMLIQKQKDNSSSVMKSSRVQESDLAFLVSTEKSYSFLKGLVYLRESVLASILKLLLVLFLFLERFSFFVLIFKMKCLNFNLVLVITMINLLVSYCKSRRNKQRVQNKMHKLFTIE